MSRRDLTNCRAIITGASSGIGQALARRLAPHKARLVLVARREARLRELAAELTTEGATCEIVAGDIASDETRQACIDRASQSFDGLDLLINNAGIGASGEFADSDEDTLRRVMEVNFFALAELTRLAIPLLRQGNDPAIVNVSSIIGHHGLPALSEYSASKGAVRGFSEALRAELVDSIHVMVVSPATTATEFFDKLPEAAESEELSAQRWKAKRPLSPDAVARAAINGLRKGKREVFPGLTPKFIRIAERISPRLVAWVIESNERKARQQTGER